MVINRLEKLKEMAAQKPDDPFLQYAIAQEYGATGQLAEALSIYQTLLDKQPDYLPTYYQLGKLYEELGQFGDAQRAYEQGMIVAQQQGNMKTLGELRAALEEM